MAKQTFTVGQVLTAAQMTSLQQTAMGGGSTTAKTASYVLVAADAGTVVQMNSASATTITVNTALFAAGDTVQIQNVGVGVCTVTAGTATVNTSSTLALKQYDAGSLYFNTTSAAIFFASDAADGSSPLTTKGDLYGFSTLDARIPIGTNNQVLTADSAQALGLKWATPSAGGTFAAWTPTWTGVTVGNGVVTAQYAEVGSLVFGYIKLEWGSTTSQAGDVVFSLPVTAVYPTLMNWGVGRQYKSGQAQVMLGISMTSTTTMEMRYHLQTTTPDRVRDNSINAGSPYTMANGDSYSVNFWFRKA